MTNNASPEGEKILEGNKLIEAFFDGTEDRTERWYRDRCQYHSSWDWLKPIVDKIFTYSLAHKDQTERLRKTSIVVDITPCWQICVDFITWYNQQTPSNGK